MALFFAIKNMKTGEQTPDMPYPGTEQAAKLIIDMIRKADEAEQPPTPERALPEQK